MLLDTLISKCINRITREHIIDKQKWTKNEFCQAIFQLENCTDVAGFDPLIADLYLTEGALNYNNRANALHYSAPYNPENPNGINNNTRNFLTQRKHNSITDYVNDFNQTLSNDSCNFLKEEFFNIKIKNKYDCLLPPDKPENLYPCFVVDGIDYQETNPTLYDIMKKALIVIHVIEQGNNQVTSPDLLIKMRCHEDKDCKYMTYQMRVCKSTLQATALGWHQYKKRDEGIEIYPSTHVLLQRRRHLPKSLSRGCMDAFTDTYQQFIDRKGCTEQGFCYEAYEQYKRTACSNNLKNNFHIYHHDISACKVLQDILMNNNDTSSYITTIIGAANTYKRFLSLGSTFSAASMQQQSLYILLDQEPETMQKRIVCPTWSSNATSISPHCVENGCAKEICQTCKKCKLHKCETCYKNIHFWGLRMGNIKPDEFFYYLIRQISTLRNIKGSNLKRIIIDDIQKIEYSFPLLKKDPLFLTTLISICKDYKVELMILCDKNASLVNELRSLSDNVICTERIKKESRLYIERYAGYNSPSHIFGCRIPNIENLFLCETYDSKTGFSINRICMEAIYVPNMDHYWVCNDTNKFINHLK